MNPNFKTTDGPDSLRAQRPRRGAPATEHGARKRRSGAGGGNPSFGRSALDRIDVDFASKFSNIRGEAKWSAYACLFLHAAAVLGSGEVRHFRLSLSLLPEVTGFSKNLYNIF